ncbi:MAG: type III secretion inner membrane ring lipoprotein SctJ [Methylococcales bacterium]|nr:type III secretion inner membrane ring lipoprotein SctJ [Methylococcales bacterium]
MSEDLIKNNQHITPAPFFHRGIGRLILIMLLLQLTACKEPLFTNVKEEHANEMMSILLRNGIDAEKLLDKKTHTLTLLVNKSDLPASLTLLKQQGYPKESYKKVIDVFNKEGLISSPLEERVRYIYALTQEVQETLTQIDGVITARVHVVLPKNDPFGDNIVPSSASIFIKYLPGSNLQDIRSSIKFIVEKSIEGLEYKKISLAMLPAMDSVKFQNNVQWKNILGVRMPQDSVYAFQVLFGILIASLLVACIAIVFLLQRLGELSQSGNDDVDDEQVNILPAGQASWNNKIKPAIPPKQL